MKTIASLLLLATLANTAPAQPTPAPPTGVPAPAVAPAESSATTKSNRAATFRELMRSRMLAGTNNAASNAPAAAAASIAPATGTPGPMVIPAPTTAPAAATGLPGPAAAPGAAPAGPAAGPGTPAMPAPGAAMPAALPAAATAAAMDDVATNTFNFPAIDLNTFLNDFYAPMVGRTILRSATLPAAIITLRTMTPLTRKESIQAFDTVLSMNGITTIPTGTKFVKVVQTPQALQEAAEFSRLNATNLPDAAQFVTHIVQLKYVKPSEIMPILTPFGKIPNSVLPVEGSQMLVIRDFAENVKRMLELISDIDVAIPSEFISEVIPIKYALASEISSALSSLSSGGGATSVGSTGGGQRSGFGGSGGASRFGRAGGAGGFGTTTPGMPGQMGTSPFGTTTPGATPGMGTQPTFSDRLRSIIQKASSSGGDFQILGQTKIIADDRTNSLLIFASREDMKMIKDIVAKLDVVLPQVLIEATIIEVSLNNNESYGISYVQTGQQNGSLNSAWSQITQGATPVNPPTDIGSFGTNLIGGFNWFGKLKNDFYASLTAAASDGRITVLSRPVIQTSTAKEASLFVGESRPYPTSSYYGGGAYGGYSQIQQLPIGISLDVMPLVNQDGLVVMDIQQKVDSVGDEVAIQGVGNVPSTFSRSANASVSVRSGDTIILGGFIKNNDSRANGGVPLLKDIPLLGNLFRNSSKNTQRQELIILIRPTVLPNPSDAALAVKAQQSQLPLVRQAEADFNKLYPPQGQKPANKDSKSKPGDARANDPTVWGPPPAN